MSVAGVVFATAPAVGGPTPLTPLAGLPMIGWAISALRDGADLAQLVVVADPTGAGVDGVAEALDRALPGHGTVLVAAGDTRHRSLHHVLSIIDSPVQTVLLHDGWWPLASAELVSRVVAAVQSGAPAAVPAVEVTETVKGLDAAGRVSATVPRESLVRLQAPQGVRRALLEAAHAGCRLGAADIDDAVALTPTGIAPVTVPGEHAVFPVLDPADLALAEAVLATR